MTALLSQRAQIASVAGHRHLARGKRLPQYRRQHNSRRPLDVPHDLSHRRSLWTYRHFFTRGFCVSFADRQSRYGPPVFCRHRRKRGGRLDVHHLSTRVARRIGKPAIGNPAVAPLCFAYLCNSRCRFDGKYIKYVIASDRSWNFRKRSRLGHSSQDKSGISTAGLSCLPGR
jgi:hypothetical protein